MSLCQQLSLRPVSIPFSFWPNPSIASAWKKTTISIELIFQRWISWFPQRWRTPRNAICNVNCRIKWIIKSLNANCCSDYFSWSMPGSDSVNHHNPHLNCEMREGWGVWFLKSCALKKNNHCRSTHADSNRSRYFLRSVFDESCLKSQTVWSWAQVRRPAEFKHITKRRKRN